MSDHAELISDWAFIRACGLVGRKPHHVRSMAVDNPERRAISGLADYIAQHESPPVDRKTLCAREACAKSALKWVGMGFPIQYRSGEKDDSRSMEVALEAINLWESGHGK